MQVEGGGGGRGRGRTPRSGLGAGAGGGEHDVVLPGGGAPLDDRPQAGAGQGHVHGGVQPCLWGEHQPVGVIPLQLQLRRHQVDLPTLQPARPAPAPLTDPSPPCAALFEQHA